MLSFEEYQGLLALRARIWPHLGTISSHLNEVSIPDEHRGTILPVKGSAGPLPLSRTERDFKDRMATSPLSWHTHMSGGSSGGTEDPCAHLRTPLYPRKSKKNPGGLTAAQAKKQLGADVVADEKERLRQLRACRKLADEQASTGSGSGAMDTLKLSIEEVNGEIYRQVQKLNTLGLINPENAKLLMSHDWGQDLKHVAMAYGSKYGGTSMQAVMWTAIQELWQKYFNPCNYGTRGCDTPDPNAQHYEQVAHAYAMLVKQYHLVGVSDPNMARRLAGQAIRDIIIAHDQTEERRQKQRSHASTSFNPNSRVKKKPIHWRDIQSEVFLKIRNIVANAEYTDKQRYAKEVKEADRGGPPPRPLKKFISIDRSNPDTKPTTQDKAEVEKILGPRQQMADGGPKPRSLEELLAKDGKQIHDLVKFLRSRYRRYGQNAASREEGDLKSTMQGMLRAQQFSQFDSDETNPFADTLYDKDGEEEESISASDENPQSIPKMLRRGGAGGGDQGVTRIVDVIKRTALRVAQEIKQRDMDEEKVGKHERTHSEFLWALAFISEGLLTRGGKAKSGGFGTVKDAVEDIIGRVDSRGNIVDSDDPEDIGSLEREVMDGEMKNIDLDGMAKMLGKYAPNNTSNQRIKVAIHMVGLALAKMEPDTPWANRINLLYKKIMSAKRADIEVAKIAQDPAAGRAYAAMLDKSARDVTDDEFTYLKDRGRLSSGRKVGDVDTPGDDRWYVFGREMKEKEQNKAILLGVLHEIADRMVSGGGAKSLESMKEAIIQSLSEENGKSELHGLFNSGAAAARRPDKIKSRVIQAVETIVDAIQGAHAWVEKRKAKLSNGKKESSKKAELNALKDMSWAKLAVTIEKVIRNEPSPMAVIKEMKKSPGKFVRWAGYVPRIKNIPSHKDSASLYPTMMRQAGETIADKYYDKQKQASSLKGSDEELEAWLDALLANKDDDAAPPWAGRDDPDVWWKDQPARDKKKPSIDDLFPRRPDKKHNADLHPLVNMADKLKKRLEKDKESKKEDDEAPSEPKSKDDDGPKQGSLFGDDFDVPTKKKRKGGW